ncbi:MAG: hypothetical protein EPO35_10545 [Acidobacteria bacterium]|nr:MAG: hypothetical protein EPO35_10545 [Acidobacteriota bacterium]
MAHAFRLFLVAAVMAATSSLPAGQTRVEQTNPVCAAKCADARDRKVAAADKMLADKEYYSTSSSNCWTLTNAPNCTAIRATCQSACAPSYTRACLATCEPPFQACCAANDKTRAEREFDVCVAACPLVQAPTLDRASAWKTLVTEANTKLATVGSDLGGLDLERFNDMRRALAFMQVRASMALHGAKYAIVSGGNGRVWIIRAGGQQVLLSEEMSRSLHNQADPRLGLVDEEQRTSAALSQLAGITAEEALDCLRQTRIAAIRKSLDPGTVLEFPAWQGWPQGALASSEHTSIRGTINGGGDFI